MQRARFFRAVSHIVLGLILLALAVIPQSSGTAAEKVARAPRFDVVAVVDNSSRTYGANLEDQKRALTKYIRSLPPTIRVAIVSVGKQLSRNWYVGYERGLNATTGNWQLIYRLAQRFTIRAQSGESNSIELIWSWRWQ